MFYNRNFERAAKYFVASVRDHCGCKTLVINRDDGLSAISDGRYTYSPGTVLIMLSTLFLKMLIIFSAEDVKGAKMREVTELVKEVPEIEVHDPSSPPATPEPNQEQEEDGRKCPFLIIELSIENCSHFLLLINSGTIV